MSPRRAAQIVVGVIAVAVLVTVVVLAVSGPRTFAEGTPERAAQDLLEALADGDVDAALARIPPEHRADCEDDFEAWWDGRSRDVSLIDSRVDGDKATLRLEFDSSADIYDPFFDFDRYGYEIRFDLERVDGTWYVVDGDWMLYCLREV